MLGVVILSNLNFQAYEALGLFVLWFVQFLVPTVREEDGLALSSRNQYLNADERTQATVLYRAMTRVRDLAEGGQKSVSELIEVAKGVIKSAKSARVDYVSIIDADNLQPLETLQPKAVIALAVFIGKTRLIDNLRLT